MTNTDTFKQLGIIEPIIQVCTEKKFKKPTEIQKKAIPYVIAGKDVIGEAATGSGKTLAFASGIIQSVSRGKGVQSLIITPTRELTQQISEMIHDLSKYKPLKITAIYGGVSINPQINNLRRADVVVGTPGRLLDHIGRGTIRLGNVKILVLDECDRLLDMGFLPDVERIIRQLPEKKKRQTLLFSATISFEVNKLAQKYMYNPIDVEATSFVDPAKLTQYYYGPVDNSLKFSLLVHLLEQNKRTGLSMIFCNTRRYAEFVAKNLINYGLKATALHGGLSQSERTKRFNRFQNRRHDVLVATDVAARGLDIQGVTNIFNYDLPDNRKQYIHRIGRTARAGKEGKAITLVAQRDNEKFFHLFRDNRNGIQKGNLPFIKRITTERMPSKFRPRNRSTRSPTRKMVLKNTPSPSYSRYSL
ncbi:MAG: DEAD/DEAH box helicase [Candidatus Hodarchaeales archaeon]|jgi:ATP-dependent RNA helicase DeaD